MAKSLSAIAGFSIMELIGVMTIVGILGVMTYPRLIDFSAEAGKASYDAITESLESEAAIKRAICATAGRARYPGTVSILINGNRVSGDCMNRVMPPAGIELTVLSDTTVSANINGKTELWVYDSSTGEASHMSGLYNDEQSGSRAP